MKGLQQNRRMASRNKGQRGQNSNRAGQGGCRQGFGGRTNTNRQEQNANSRQGSGRPWCMGWGRKAGRATDPQNESVASLKSSINGLKETLSALHARMDNLENR